MISGAVRMLTPGATVDGAVVQLITLREGQTPEAVELPLRSDGQFESAAAADPAITYLIAVRYDGIQYLSNPLLLSPDFPTATTEIEVYATTNVAPALEIESTTVTLLAIDRENSELTLVREDLVRHDEPVVYVGGDDGVTLRLPVPDGTVDAGGFEDGDDAFSFDGGTVAVTTALNPGVTSVVTRYIVRYEPNQDEYRLRVTAPLLAQRVEVRIPERFVREIRPQDNNAAFGPDADFQGETLTVIERTTPARSGQSLVVDLLGLSGIEPATHPLTSGVGAAIGAVLALVIVTALAIGLHRTRSRPTEPAP